MNILSKLYTWSVSQAIQDIALHREKSGHCVVHFLYFANAIKQQLFDTNVIPTVVEGSPRIDQDLSTSLRSAQDDVGGYRHTLTQADFLLPDGIALQTYYAAAVLLGRIQSTRTWLANCNGTDLTLPLLNTVQKTYPWLVIHLYGGRSATAEKARIFLHDNGLLCGVVQDWYTARDWNNIAPFSGAKQVLLVARWTPLQELRIQENMETIKKNNILVLSVGWLFEFRSGEEKRTPKVFRGRAEWLWRMFANPRKNAIKVRYSLYLPYAIIRYLLLKR